MKIYSREPSHVGEGDYTLKMSFEELQYVAALLYITRLGPGVYKEAAFKLMGTIEDLFGEDFMESSAVDVDLSVSKLDEDDGDTVIDSWHCSEICVEV